MKLVLIGGAGVRAVFFTRCLLNRCKKLGIDEFVLMDINEKKLNTIGALCEIEARRSKIGLNIKKTTNPIEAIKGAHWIVTTIRAGEEHSRVIDEHIALKYGVIGQETTGPGGFSMAMRSIGVIEEYCRLAQEYAPDAWMFNFTNPSGLVTQAMRQKGFNRVVGICDTPGCTQLHMANALGVNPENLRVDFFGLNHLSWIGSVKHNGNELLQDLVRDSGFLKNVEEFSIFDPSLIAILGYLPNEYLYYYYYRETAVANILKSGQTRGEVVEKNSREMLEELNKIDIQANPDRAMQIYMLYNSIRENSYMRIEANMRRETEKAKKPGISEGYAGVAFDFIELIQDGNGNNKHLVLSIPNSGSIPGLKDDDVVEISCRMEKDGPVPLKAGYISEPCMNLIRNVKLYERLVAEAHNKRSGELAVEALMVHPLVGSYSLAKSIVDDIFNAYGYINMGWK